MARKMYSYQADGVDYMKSHRIALLADEPGLGKTVQALKSLNEGERAVIICPAAVREVWKSEAAAWLGEEIKTIILTSRNAKTLETFNLYIVSFDGVLNQKIFNKIKSLRIESFIIDEAHYLKNSKTKRFKQILNKNGLVTKENRIMLLTGTPIINRPLELFSWMSKLVPEILGEYDNYYSYVKKFCAGKMKIIYMKKHGQIIQRKILDTSGSSNETELRALLSSFCLRRKKSEVLPELPEKYYQVVELESSPSASKLLKQESGLLESLSEQECTYRVKFGEIAKVRKALALLKLAKAIEFIKDALEMDNKIVIFCHHRDVAKELLLKLSKFKPVLLIGGMSLVQQKKSIDLFMTDPKTRVFIGNIQSAGVGITLTVASKLIFVEIPFSPSDINQCTDRCHRIGQKNSVLAQFLVFKNSFDSLMIKNLVKKLECINKVFE